MEDLVFIIIGILITVFLSLLIMGGLKVFKSKKGLLKYFPLITVVLTILAIVGLYYYYEYEINSDNKRFHILADQMYTINTDHSLTLPTKERQLTLDSLILIRNQMNDILEKVQNKEKTIGESYPSLDLIKSTISVIELKIDKYSEYNEVIPDSVYSKIYSTHIMSGNTSDFSFLCPQEEENDYITLQMLFTNDNLVDRIETICIDVYKIEGEKVSMLLMRRFYKPQYNMNAFMIKNYLKDNDNIDLLVGYFLKNEINDSPPRFYKITCRYTKN